MAQEHQLELLDSERGAPDNKGLDFTASHPVVRTNPVTGWKSLFGAGHQVHNGWIDNVTEVESEIIKDYCSFATLPGQKEDINKVSPVLKLIAENHDLQVRFRWNKNDLAIWDK